MCCVTVNSAADLPRDAQEQGQLRTVFLFSKYEKTISSGQLGVEGSFDPYDPKSIKVDARVTVPGGRKRTIPCFWHIPHERIFVTEKGKRVDSKEGAERFQKTGAGKWCFRFCPLAEGHYSYYFTVSRKGRSWRREGGSFRALRGDDIPPGFVRLPQNCNYFRFQNGELFVPVGLNLGWPDKSGSKGYEKWLKLLHEAGGNCGRLWLVHYFSGTALEWSESEDNPGYEGVGKFSQRSAARMDSILESATRHDIYLILSFFSFGDTNWDWEENPYSQKAGGWLRQPSGFFVNARAQKAVQNRLRYAAARYGWCPNIWAWELWNEVETSAGFESQAVLNWHKEMARYLKQVDDLRHLITTSYRFTPPSTECRAYGSDDIDFIQTHSYLPQITRIFERRVKAVAKFNKPVVIAEYGLDVSPDYFDADPAGLHVHDGLWAGLFSGSAGGGMTWWWKRYVDARDLYFHFSGISRFLKKTQFKPAKPCDVSVRPRSADYFAFGLQADDKTLVWLGPERQITWELFGEENGQVRSYRSGSTAGKVKIILKGDRKGKHTVVFFDTFDGVPLKKIELTGTKKGLFVPVSGFTHDIALAVYPGEGDATLRIPKKPETPLHERFEKGFRRQGRGSD